MFAGRDGKTGNQALTPTRILNTIDYHLRSEVFAMYRANIEDITIHYDRLGSGEPLLLLHGLGERKEGWEYQHALASAYDVIIPDLRGHGRSEQTEGITMENFAKDILGLMDQLGIESAHICGLSMGGVVAQEMYRQAPQRFRSLILVNTFFYVPRMLQGLLYQSWNWRLTYLPTPLRMHMAASACLFRANEETLARYRHAITPGKSTYRQTLQACVQVNNSRLLPKITVPTLILASDYDLLTPLWIQVMMHHLIPHSHLVVLRHAGHMVKLEQPDAFNQAIRQFLDGRRPAAVSS
jgi:3-oxoadipate enol-lactonase